MHFRSHLASPERFGSWHSHAVGQNSGSDGPQFMPLGLFKEHIVIELQGMLVGNATYDSATVILRERLTKATMILLMGLFSDDTVTDFAASAN